MTVSELQAVVDNWIRTHGVRYFDPLSNMVILMEEVGELSRIMVRKYGEQSFKHSKDEAQANEKIKEEISDVLFVLCCIANQTGIDLTASMKANLEKKTSRDADRHKQNPKL